MHKRHPLWEQIDPIEKRILKISNPVVKQDLLKLLRTVFTEMSNLSKESVECRRLDCVTTKYTAITKNAEEYIKKIDKYLSMYSLME